MNEHLYLAGFRGTGKSAVGRALALRLEVPLVDLDALIQSRAGCTIADIFSRGGEPEFRRLETEALTSASDGAPAVIALGGGAPLSPLNRERIAATGRCVLLTASAETILQRLTADAHSRAQRPALTKLDQLAEIHHLLQARREVYEAVAHFRVDTEGRDVDGIADEIAAWVEWAEAEA